MCAITAAQRGRSVLVLERSNKPGKKILMSGGGRCNFTNTNVEPENFLSENPHFCKSALSQYSQWDFIEWVTNHSIAYHEKKLGQLFCDRSSKDVLNALLHDLDAAGVELVVSADVEQVEMDSGYILGGQFADGGRFRVQGSALVVATGGLSIPTLGGSGFGYSLADSLGLPLIPRRAGLVPFTFTDHVGEICAGLSGVSLDAEISNDCASFREAILFTHRGLSGPASLQLSNYWREEENFSVDLCPTEQLEEAAVRYKRSDPKMLLRSFLAKYLPRRLVLSLEEQHWSERAEWPLAQWPDADLRKQMHDINNWVLKPSGTEGYRTAEVTLGGIDTRSVSSKTMESKQHSGLYFVGEVLDVTGHLGGYNFQWAWSSGYVAGINL